MTLVGQFDKFAQARDVALFQGQPGEVGITYRCRVTMDAAIRPLNLKP